MYFGAVYIFWINDWTHVSTVTYGPSDLHKKIIYVLIFLAGRKIFFSSHLSPEIRQEGIAAIAFLFQISSSSSGDTLGLEAVGDRAWRISTDAGIYRSHGNVFFYRLRWERGVARSHARPCLCLCSIEDNLGVEEYLYRHELLAI